MVVVRQQLVTRECWTEAEAVAAARTRFSGPSSSRQGAAAETQRELLLKRAVETEVIPRLLLAQRVAPSLLPVVPKPGIVGARHVGELVDLVLAQELPAVAEYVDELRFRGAPLEDVYLDLLAPAARRLGDLWTEDKCDFTEVTVGLWRLQQVTRELGPAFHGNADLVAAGPRALLVPLPGEQHTFGLSMVVDFFRRAGWGVWSGAVASNADLASLVRGQSFALVGFSVATGDRLDQVGSCIRLVRRSTCNPHVGVMVGGPAFAEHPELAAAVGADATAIDGRQAVAQAHTLLTLKTGQQ
jgi:methanogenic corrinoid protein MtbC1